MTADKAIFADFVSPLIELPLSHLWRGHGTAIFLEFGKLTESGRRRRDGSQSNPRGEFSAMIQWSWRIEGRKSILCGSWDDETKWERGFNMLRGMKLIDASIFGHLPELRLSFDNGAHCVSFMTAAGHPEWTISDRNTNGRAGRTLYSRNGRITFEG